MKTKLSDNLWLHTGTMTTHMIVDVERTPEPSHVTTWSHPMHPPGDYESLPGGLSWTGTMDEFRSEFILVMEV